MRDHARLAIALLVVLGAGPKAPAADRPNVVVIVADDLGFADVGFHGLADFDTPHLDALARSGVTFTAGYVSHPYCSPSRAGILTGRYQQRFGHEGNPPPAPDDPTMGTPTDEVFLAQVLGDAGYRTAAIGKWHLGDAPGFLPHHRGFDRFFGFSGGGHNYYGVTNPRRPEVGIVRGDDPVPAGEIDYLTDDFTDEAVAFIRESSDRPLFLYLAYNAVHSPDQAPRRYLERSDHVEDPFRTVYAAMAIAMDDGVGRVVEALDAIGEREDTLIVFLSDNGGRIGSDNRPLRGHKGMLYEGGIRVPFVMSWPARLPAGASYDEPVIALDIVPTAAAAAGASTAACKPLDGVNLLPFLEGEAEGPPHDALFWRVSGGLGYAVRQGRYKLVKPAALDRERLFDLEADPREKSDLAGAMPEVLSRLRATYGAWDAQLMEPRWSDPHPENVRKERAAVEDARNRALPPSERDGQ